MIKNNIAPINPTAMSKPIVCGSLRTSKLPSILLFTSFKVFFRICDYTQQKSKKLYFYQKFSL